MANQISPLDQLVWLYLKQKGFDRSVEAFTTDLSETSLLTWDVNANANEECTLEQIFNSFVESNGLSVVVHSKSKKDKKKKQKEKRKNSENVEEVAEEPAKKKKKANKPQEDQQKSQETTESNNGSHAKDKKKKKKKIKNTEIKEEIAHVEEQENKNDDAIEEDDFVIKKPVQATHQNGTTPKKQNGSTPKKNGNKITFDDEQPVPEQSEKNEAGSPSFGKKKNEPFRRIREDEVEIADSRLKDNSYFAKKGDDYGRKANEDLMKVKGKGFRQAKTKKKKSTFFGGGAIDTGVNSVKFEYSDDE